MNYKIFLSLTTFLSKWKIPYQYDIFKVSLFFLLGFLHAEVLIQVLTR